MFFVSEITVTPHNSSTMPYASFKPNHPLSLSQPIIENLALTIVQIFVICKQRKEKAFVFKKKKHEFLDL